jgi:hypothetical protein
MAGFAVFGGACRELVPGASSSLVNLLTIYSLLGHTGSTPMGAAVTTITDGSTRDRMRRDDPK